MTTPEISSLLWCIFVEQYPLIFDKDEEEDMVADSPSTLSDDEMEVENDWFIPMDPDSIGEIVHEESIPVSPVLRPLPPCEECLLPLDDDFVLWLLFFYYFVFFFSFFGRV